MRHLQKFAKRRKNTSSVYFRRKNMPPPLSLHKYIFTDTTPTYTTTTLPCTDTTTTLVCTDRTTWYYLNSPKVETRLCCDVMLKQAANKQQREPRKQGEREPQSRRWREEENVVAWGNELKVAETHICSPLCIGSRSGSPWSVRSDCWIISQAIEILKNHVPFSTQ